MIDTNVLGMSYIIFMNKVKRSLIDFLSIFIYAQLGYNADKKIRNKNNKTKLNQSKPKQSKLNQTILN